MTPTEPNFKEREIELVDGSTVDIGHDKDGFITLWACVEYGDEPSRMTPEQALNVAEALTLAALGYTSNDERSTRDNLARPVQEPHS